MIRSSATRERCFAAMVLYRLGNKSKLAPRILPFIPEHQLWLEPFFGAGGMFFQKPRAQRNIVNDLDSEVFNLFTIITDRRAELEEAWAAMPIHEDLWKHWKKETPPDPVWRAVRFLFQSNFGFLGKPQTLVWNRKNAKRLLQERIAITQEQLYDVEFMNVDFRQMLCRIPLSKRERANAFVYCDPPYINTDSNYRVPAKWKEADLQDLVAMLVASGIRFAVSEFDSPGVLSIAAAHGLHVQVLGERQNLRNRRTEVLLRSCTQPHGVIDVRKRPGSAVQPARKGDRALPPMETVAAEQSADARAVAFLRRFRNPIHYAINLEGVPAHQRDDVFQEVSERILKWHRDGRVMQEHPGLLSLVITTTRNICRNHYERDRRHRGHQDINEHHVAGHEADALEQLHRLQAHERLHACVELLPPMQRLVMRHVLRGCVHAEVAVQLGLNTNHVKQLAHRARIALRQMLTNPMLN